MQKIFFLCLLFPLIHPQCLNFQTPECHLCSSDYYDSSYLTELKISLSAGKLLTVSQCLLKNSSPMTRHILVANSACNLNNLTLFDACYENLLAAFENESIASTLVLNSNLTFSLTEGNHYIMRNLVNTSGEELFRRNLVEIVIQPVNSSQTVIVNIKTNEFYIFISKSLKIQNIFFTGADLESQDINDPSACYNTPQNRCCSESNYSMNYDGYNNCFLSSRSISKVQPTINYALFNTEFITDLVGGHSPQILINNCSFSNFLPILVNKGWSSLLALAPYLSALVTLQNILVDKCYFPKGFIYFSLSSFDLLSSLINSVDSSQQSILISSCLFQNYNQYLIENVNFGNFSFVNLFDFQGNFTFQNSTFNNFQMSKSVIFFQNSFSSGNLTFLNVSLSGVYKTLILNLQNLNFVWLTNLIITNASNVDSFIIMNSIISTLISNLRIFSGLITTNSNGLYFLNSPKIFITNSIFFNLTLYNLIYFKNSEIIIQNTSFITVYCSYNLLNFLSKNFSQISQSYFSNVYCKNAIFFSSALSYLLLTDCILKNSSSFNIFFLVSAYLNLNQGLLITNGNYINIWSTDHTCFITRCEDSAIINNNISSKILGLYSMKNIKFIGVGLQVRFNNFTSVFMIKMFVGFANFSNCVMTNNYFLSTADFSYVMDFGQGHILYMDGCYYQDNGVITKKTYYLAKSENLFIIFLAESYAMFSNCFFVVGKLIDMVSGFILGMPFSGNIELNNNTFLIIERNLQFRYKAIILDWFKTAYFRNNTFLNIACNDMDFYHSHGTVMLDAAAGFAYTPNTIFAYLENNVFLNCTCLHGGGLVIIGISRVFLKNNTFQNISADYYAGNVMIFGGLNTTIQTISMADSISDEASGMYLWGIAYVSIENLSLKRAHSRKNGVIICKDIANFTLVNSIASDLVSEMNGGFIYIFHSVAFIKNVSISSTQAMKNGGAVFLHGGSSMTLVDCNIFNSSAAVGGGFSIENGLNISILNCNFLQNTASLKGAGLFIDVLKKFNMRNNSLINCTTQGNGIFFIKTEDELANFKFENLGCENTWAAQKGSCFYYLAASELSIVNLRIINNGPLPFFALWSFPINVTLSNVQILNTSNSDNIAFIEGINVWFVNWTIYGSKTSRFIEFRQIEAFLENIQLFNNQGEYFMNLQNSVVSLSNISFANDGSKVFELSGVYLTNSDLYMSQVLIFNAFTGDSALFNAQIGTIIVESSQLKNNVGQLFKLTKINITLSNSTFFNNSQSDVLQPNEILFENTVNFCFSISIISCYFGVSQGFTLSASGMLVINISNSSYISLASSVKSQFAFAFKISDAIQVNISSCNFTEFNKGTIILKNSLISSYSILIISKSIFLNNTANIGSAIYLSGNFQTSIINSIFQGNQAIMDPNNSNNNMQGIAPCVFFRPSDSKLSRFEVTSTTFINNTAEFIGPSTFSQLKLISSKNTFINNSDENMFSDRFFSFPLFLNNRNVSNSSVISIASGVAFSLYLTLVDSFQQRLVFDNATILIIKNQVQDSEFRNTSSISIEKGQTQAKMGYFTFPDLKIKIKPDSNFTLLVSGIFAGLSNNQYNELNTYTIVKTLDFYARECQIGEILLPDNSCYFCPKDTYSLIDPMKVEIKYQKCHQCMPNCFCDGGLYITPEPGYYRKYNDSLNAAPCLSFDACLGSSFIEPLYGQVGDFDTNQSKGICREGNSETLCFYCEYEYGRYEKTDYCKKCAELSVLVYFRLLFYVFIMILYILLNCHFAENIHKEKKNAYSNFSTFFKIVINHSQHITIILMASGKFPFPSFSGIFNLSDYLSFSNDHVVTNDCLLQKLYYDKSTNIIFKEVFNTLLPIMFSLLSFGLWVLSLFLLSHFKIFAQMDKKIPKSVHSFLSKFLLFILISIFVFYSLIVKSSFGLFTCMIIDENEPHTYLKESPDLQCWDSRHMKYIFFVGLPGLLTWGVLFPIFLFLVLKQNLEIIKMAEFTRTNMSQTIPKVSLPSNENQVNIGKHHNSYLQEVGEQKKGMNYQNFLTEEAKESDISHAIHLKKDNGDHLIKLTQEVDNGRLEKNEKKTTEIFNEHDQNQKIQIDKESARLDRSTKFADRSSLMEINQKIEQSQIFVFFYKDFTAKYYYWECLIFVRKFVLSFLASMTETLPPEIICLVMLIGLFVSLMMTMEHNPYKLKSANSVEICSLFVCMITVISSLIFQSNSPSNFINFIAVVCVIFNLSFFVLDVFYFVVDSYNRLQLIKSTKSSETITLQKEKQTHLNILRVRNFQKGKKNSKIVTIH